MALKDKAEQGTDMTEIMAAAAKLRGGKPPSGPVVMPVSMFPVSERIKKEETAKRAANPEPGDQMPDGTFYLGRFAGKDGTEKDWFTAATDIKNESGKRLLLDFNRASQYAEASEAHGHNDWIIPPSAFDSDEEPNILNAVFNNKAKIGKEAANGFDETGAYPDGWYWSSTRSLLTDDIMRVHRLMDGDVANADKRTKLPTRLVRSVTVS